MTLPCTVLQLFVAYLDRLLWLHVSCLAIGVRSRLHVLAGAHKLLWPCCSPAHQHKALKQSTLGSFL